MKNRVLVLTLVWMLAACAPVATPEPPPTATMTPFPPPSPTATPTPTYTPTTEPTLAPITLGAFNAKLEGVGSNGTMACYTYDGDAQGLEGLTLKANLSQGSNLVEKDIPSQQIGGKNCFEVVDAKYIESVNPADGMLVISEDKLSLEINATSPEGRPLQNNNQTLDLGKYVQFPFLGWIYDTNKVCGNTGHTGYTAWDLAPYPSSEHPTIINKPILSPTNGIAYVKIGASNSGSGVNHNSIILFSPATGFLIDLTHDADFFINSEGKYKLLADQMGKSVETGEIIAMIGPKDDESGAPHTHMQILIHPTEVNTSMNPSELTTKLFGYVLSHAQTIDPIKSRLFLDEAINNYSTNLPGSTQACGSISWGTLSMPPQQLPITIDGNASDWASYSPVLIDPAGDSQAGNVMDFTELYTAKDDNYLYIMIKAGKKPDMWDLTFYS